MLWVKNHALDWDISKIKWRQTLSEYNQFHVGPIAKSYLFNRKYLRLESHWHVLRALLALFQECFCQQILSQHNNKNAFQRIRCQSVRESVCWLLLAVSTSIVILSSVISLLGFMSKSRCQYNFYCSWFFRIFKIW